MTKRQADRPNPWADYDDRRLFDSMSEALLDLESYTALPSLHEPPTRGRRTEPGYGSIMVTSREGPSPIFLSIGNGKLVAALGPEDADLAAISRWPASRRFQALLYIGLWDCQDRLLFAWPKGSESFGEYITLVGQLRFSNPISVRDCRRTFVWLVREARTFESGLAKVLRRKKGIDFGRAVDLSSKYLARYVRPRNVRSVTKPVHLTPFDLMAIEDDPRRLSSATKHARAPLGKVEVTRETIAITDSPPEESIDQRSPVAKYEPLREFLGEHDRRAFRVSFEDIERLLGQPLPDSARKRRSYWANDLTHSHARVWLSEGWETADVHLSPGEITFAPSTRALHRYIDWSFARLMSRLSR